MNGTEYLMVYIATAIGFCCVGYIIRIWITTTGIFSVAVMPQQKQTKTKTTTKCYKCKKTYEFIKKINGKTRVKCPFCFSRGVVT